FAGRQQHYFGAFFRGWLTRSEQGRYAFVKKRQPVLTAVKVSPRVQDRDRQRPSRAPQWLPAPEASRAESDAWLQSVARYRAGQGTVPDEYGNAFRRSPGQLWW